MARQRPPAIERPFTDSDREIEVLTKPFSDVHFVRGMGDSGRRVEIVSHDCPNEHCSFDRMIRLVRVNPESRTEVEYWCMSPNCYHYVEDQLNWACHGSSIVVTQPTVRESA